MISSSLVSIIYKLKWILNEISGKWNLTAWEPLSFCKQEIVTILVFCFTLWSFNFGMYDACNKLILIYQIALFFGSSLIFQNDMHGFKGIIINYFLYTFSRIFDNLQWIFRGVIIFWAILWDYRTFQPWTFQPWTFQPWTFQLDFSTMNF